MTYRCRKLPPTDHNSVYWPQDELEFIENDPIPVARKISKTGEINRKYIDPWDLENYAYIHRNMISSSDQSGSNTPSPAGEPISSTFYYMAGSGNGDDCPNACYAGLDEELFYNAKYEAIQEDPAYSIYYTDIESSSTERNSSSCGGSSVSTLQLHTPGFGVRASGRRSIVLPKPIPHIEFPPAPPSHEYYPHEASPPPPPLPPYHHHHHQQLLQTDDAYCSLTECYECLSDHIPVYATNTAPMMMSNHRSGRSSINRYPPNNFGLSKRGLLQIDYSFNWNNLYRFIMK